MSGMIRIVGTYPDIKAHDFGGFQSRHFHSLAFLKETFVQYQTDLAGLDFDFFICTCDNPESANVVAEKTSWVLTYSVTDKCRDNIMPIPDFVFSGWPEAGITSYDACSRAIQAAGERPPKTDKLFWIGTTHMHDLRQSLIRIGQEHPETLNFISMEWRDPTDDASRLEASHYISLPDHCAYSMLLDIRGAGYSGRLKLLMHAGRPVFIVQRPFREYFYSFLRPFEDYMPVKEDLSDLIQRVAQVKESPALKTKLGENARRFAQTYLTRDYALAYLRDVLMKIGAPIAPQE